MLKIRLQRVGRKHEPVFRLVLTDSKSGPKSGKMIEILGSYDSRRGEKAELNTDRIKYWISNGAKTSDTVHNMLVSREVIRGKKINVVTMSGKRKKKIEEKNSSQQPVASSQEEKDSDKEAITSSEETKESGLKNTATGDTDIDNTNIPNSNEPSTEVSTENSVDKEEVKEKTPEVAVKGEKESTEEKEKTPSSTVKAVREAD